MARTEGKRQEKRIEAVYPIRLWGMDDNGRPFIEAGTTLNISRVGALLKDTPAKLSTGDIVALRSGDKKCRFQVIWTGKEGTSEAGHIGLKSLEPEKWIWDLNAPNESERVLDTYTRAPQHENRLLERLKCSLSAEVGSNASIGRARAFITDISVGGCYISMPSPCPVEAKLTVALWVDHRTKIWLDGIVICQHAGLGMGMKFLNLSRKNIEDLNCVLETLAQSEPLSSEKVSE